MYLNKVVLFGFLCKEVQQTEKGIKFSVYTSRKGKTENIKEYHNVISYNKIQNEYFMKFAKNGSKVYVEGYLAQNKYTDKNGVEHRDYLVIVDPYNGVLNVEFGDKPKTDEEPTTDNVDDSEIPF